MGEVLLDDGDYPSIHAASIAEFYLLGDGRVRFLMYDWHKYEGHFVRRVCGQVTMQLATFKADLEPFRRALDAALIDHAALSPLN